MKAVVLVPAVIALMIFGTVHAGGVSVSARAAVLMCADSGEVLYEKNADERLGVASTTKIMTALLTLESGASRKNITVTERMTAVEGTSMGLLPGDQVSVYSLACGMLLASGNDAANAAAITVAGSVEGFSEMMNAKAESIGMTSSNFVTPSGLDAPEHYSTARDMALLGCCAIKNPEFKSICSSKSIRLSYGNPPYLRSLSNHNRMLRCYDGAVGIKTGFTKKSGRCLVSAATRGGVTLVCVTLNAPNDWNDHRTLLDYGFTQTRLAELDGDLSGIRIKIAGGNSESVGVECVEKPAAGVSLGAGEIEREVLMRPFEYAPIMKGRIVGTVRYRLGGKIIYETTLIASEKADVWKQ